MDKVAIITYDMIPDSASWGGCQRMYYLAEFLQKNGVETTVISVKKNYNQTFGNQIDFKNILLDCHNSLYREYLYSKRKSNVSDAKDANSRNLMRAIREWGKNNKWVFNLADNLDNRINNEPSTFAGFFSREWCKSNVNGIYKYLRKHNIQTVIISAPPFGMLSIAELLKKKEQSLHLIFDYRDPWNLWRDKNRMTQRTESRYLSFADKIICTNDNLTADMSKKYHMDIHKFDVVANGYSEQAWEGIEPKDTRKKDRMIITYAGSISLIPTSNLTYRDTSQLFLALNKLVEQNAKITIRLVGVAEPNSEYAKMIASKFGESIEIIPAVDNVTANKYMVDCDVLMLLHTTNDKSSRYIISGKMYDYIRAGRVIFSIGDAKGLHAQIIDQDKLGVYSENKAEEIYNKITLLYNLWLEDKLISPKINLFKYSREYQYKKYLSIIKSIVDP